MLRWSSFSAPQRLATVPVRTFQHTVKGGQKGVYRAMVVGTRDHCVTLNTTNRLTEQPTEGRILVIDRGGYGVRIRLEKAMQVHRGQNDTLLIHLLDEPTSAEGAALRYIIEPFGRGA